MLLDTPRDKSTHHLWRTKSWKFLIDMNVAELREVEMLPGNTSNETRENLGL